MRWGMIGTRLWQDCRQRMKSSSQNKREYNKGSWMIVRFCRNQLNSRSQMMAGLQRKGDSLHYNEMGMMAEAR